MERKTRKDEQWDYDGFWDNPSRAEKLEDWHKFALRMIPPASKREKCLDMASSGYFALQLKQRGYEVTPTYYDDRVSDSLREKGLTPTKLDVTGRFPFEDSAFDMITCLELIEHIKSPKNMMTEVGRVMKPDGTLLVSTPNICYWWNRMKTLIGVWKPQDWDHIRFYTPYMLERMLGDFGFKVVERKSYNVIPHAVGILPEPVRVFELPGVLEGFSYDMIFKCKKK